MDTQLRIKGHYTTRITVGDTYTVDLYDHGVMVDTLEFPSPGTKVFTPEGYAKTPEGARQYAQDHWF